MKQFKILVIIGTRPDAIKMAPLFIALKNDQRFITLLCSSGQHLQLLDQALDVFKIKADFELKAMVENQTLAELTNTLLDRFSNLYRESSPDLVLVHGDTTTAFVGSLAAFYLGISVGHIEAGLRTHDLSDPFPEEFNRQSIAKISRWNFVPTRTAYSNLLREGISEEKLLLCGNTIIDSIKLIEDKLNSNSLYKKNLIEKSILHLKIDPTKNLYILVTLHRRESFGKGVENVCLALRTIAKQNPEVRIILPVHLNPLVRKDVLRILGDEQNIVLVDPIDYDLFVFLMINCLFIITDSGGIQEEAMALSKRVLVTRNKTERTEGVESGLLKVISTDYDQILQSVNLLIHSEFSKNREDLNQFKPGQVSKQIVDYLHLKMFSS
jgi:UDP-N-acetylglucosamine 2-epimerase (non-hydrolysing)